MSIESIGLKNFTVFEDFKLKVSSGIKVFIDENGTGKTQLLKTIYSACESSRSDCNIENFLKCFRENQQDGNPLGRFEEPKKKSLAFVKPDFSMVQSVQDVYDLEDDFNGETNVKRIRVVRREDEWNDNSQK